MLSHFSRWLLLLTVVLAITNGCARSPEAKKTRHLERGNQYFAKEQYRDAMLEYRNALRIDPKNAEATRQLGLAHFHAGELVQSFARLVRAKEMEPGNPAVRLKLGTILALAEQPARAAEEAAFVLEHDPKNVEALAIMAGAARSGDEVAAAVRRLEAVRDELRAPQIHLALGTLHLRSRNIGAAEVAYRNAIAANPKAPDGHIALGNLFLSRREAAPAEQEFKTAAALAPAGSWARIKLADFYWSAGNRDEARRVLQETTVAARDFVPAWRRLAEIAYSERKYDDSIKALETIFKDNPGDVAGRLLRGKIHLAMNESPQAIQAFHDVLRQEPHLTQARHQLALAYLQAGNASQARAELRLAATADPDSAEPTLNLAELDIRNGALEPAIEALQRLIAKRPNDTRAYVLLGRALLFKKEPGKAADAYRRIIEISPKDPHGPYLLGAALKAQGKTADARKAFEAALSLKPDFAGPLAQLVSLSLAEKRPEAALERVQKQLVEAPESALFHHLLGRVQAGLKNIQAAEAAYSKALELDPSLTGAYFDLSRLYVVGGRVDAALNKLEALAARRPNNALTHTLIGTLHEHRGDVAKARLAYERALVINPRFTLAANNLAVLYSEGGGDAEKALQLAQAAREVAPNDPRIADTLGWILYKRGVYQRALALLRESADKLPRNPVVQYHLGMAAHKTGDTETARKALTAAVNTPEPFAGKDEAQAALSSLR